MKRRLQDAPTRDARHTLKDKALAHKLHQTFEDDLELAGVRGIHFYVQHGTVTLYGAIRNELDRQLLMSMVRRISGVKGVVEHLQIVDQPHQEAEAEIMIRL